MLLSTSNLGSKVLIGQTAQSLQLSSGVETCFPECGITIKTAGWHIYMVQLIQDPCGVGLRHIGYGIDSTSVRSDWIEYRNPSLNDDYTKLTTICCLYLSKGQIIYPWSHQNSGKSLSTTLLCNMIKI